MALVWLSALAPDPRPRERVELSWSAPAGCPDAERLRARIESLHGASVDALELAYPLRIVAEVRSVAELRYVLELELTSPTGSTTRTLEARSCETLTDATAFAAVVAIDEASAATREDASAPATPAPAAPAKPQPEPAPPELPAAPSPVVDGRTSARAIGGSISASALVADRVLPMLAPGVLVRGHVTGRRWAAGTRAMLLPRQVLDVGTRGGRVAFVQWAFGPELCFAQRWRVLELPICAFAELGQVRGRGSGIERPGSAARLWAAVGSTFELRLRASKRFAVGLGFEAALPLAWSTFTVDGRAVHHVAPISARGLVGVELRWPW